MAPMEVIATRARESLKQMRAKMTARYDQFNELHGQMEVNTANLKDHFKTELNKLETIREEQVSGLNSTAVIKCM